MHYFSNNTCNTFQIHKTLHTDNSVALAILLIKYETHKIFYTDNTAVILLNKICL